MGPVTRALGGNKKGPSPFEGCQARLSVHANDATTSPPNTRRSQTNTASGFFPRSCHLTCRGGGPAVVSRRCRIRSTRADRSKRKTSTGILSAVLTKARGPACSAFQRIVIGVYYHDNREVRAQQTGYRLSERYRFPPDHHLKC